MNIVQFSFNEKAEVCLTFVLILIMLKEDYDIFTDDQPDVAVELKVARPIIYTFTWTLTSICLFHRKTIKNIRNSYSLILYLDH